MKFKFTLTLFTFAFFLANVNAQILWGGPGDPNSEFDGGLNDWTVNAISSLDTALSANALWVWDADGAAGDGAYWNDRPGVESLSPGNGAAVFDSDFYDNGGTQGAFGEGLAPAPQKSELISPLIDLSGSETAELVFFQFFRNFQATTTVGVSIDGGDTYTDFPINEDVALNASTTCAFTSLNLSDIAAGQDSVKIKFTWDGDYYVWIIDDVSIIAQSTNSLAISDDEVSPLYSLGSAVQPLCAIAEDSIQFATNLSNLGADTITTVMYKVEVYNNDTDELLHSDSTTISNFPSNYMDSTMFIEELWAPENLVEGIYRIEHHIINPDNTTDYNPCDNVAFQFFEISAASFRKEILGNGAFGTWPDGAFYAIGAFYDIGSTCMENYTIASVDYAVGQVGADPEPLVGRPVEFWLWKLTVPFDEFDTETNYEEDIVTATHPSMEFVGFAIDQISSEDADADIINSDAAFLNIDGDEIMPLFEPGATYGIFAHWGTGGSTSPLHLFSREVNTSRDLFYSDGWFGGFLDTKSAPILGMTWSLYSSVDEKTLSVNEFKLFPNPASDMVNLEINLEKASDATLTIATISGQVLSYENKSNLRNDVVSFSVANYPSGTYLARIATEQGTKTLKFIVE